VLNEGTRKKLERWVKDGGTLVAVGGAAAALCKREGGIGSVRLRRDVLDELDIYAEAAARRRSALEPEFDVGQVWDFKPEGTTATSQPAKQSKEPGDGKTLQRWDVWARRFMPRGVILRAELHPEHWLAHGMRSRVPVLFGSSHVLMATSPVEVAADWAAPESVRLGGLLWPEARKRLTNGVVATRERMGRGQVILFAVDPVFRGYMRGTARMFLNAVILGPGAGASPPQPW
jgi:hypothetical protein